MKEMMSSEGFLVVSESVDKRIECNHLSMREVTRPKS